MFAKFSFTTIKALIHNLLWVFILFTVTRIIFVWCNSGMYEDHMTAGYLFNLLVAGLRFDCTAILYLNCWLILAFLLPLHIKEKKPLYYDIMRRLYVFVNIIGLGANLCDCAYFPFTGRRTTWNVLQEFGGEGNIVTIIFHEALPYWYLFVIAIIMGVVL